MDWSELEFFRKCLLIVLWHSYVAQYRTVSDLWNVNVYGEPLSDLARDWQRTEQLLRTLKFLSMARHNMLELGHGSHFCKNIVRAPVAHTL